MRFRPAWFLLFNIPLLITSTAPGLKITVHHTLEGQSTETTQYIQADRKRLEFRNGGGYSAKPGGPVTYVYGPHIAAITRCDLGESFELNLDAREYDSTPLPKWPSKEELHNLAAKSPQPAGPKNPTLLIETTTVDTGERKEFFGYAARHMITTRKQIPLEGATSGPSETVTDGWYLDLDTQLSCDPKWHSSGHAFLTASTTGGAIDIPAFKDIGKPETGFAVELKTTSQGIFTLPDGTKKEHTSTMEMQVTLLSSGPLDPALFEVPAGFRHVDHIERNASAPLSVRSQAAWQRLKDKVPRLLQ